MPANATTSTPVTTNAASTSNPTASTSTPSNASGSAAGAMDSKDSKDSKDGQTKAAVSASGGAGNSSNTASAATANGTDPKNGVVAVGNGTSADLNDPKTSYETAKKELIQAIQRKRQLDKQLVLLETQIFQAEGQYIAETAGTGGNIIHGFENYLKSASTNRKRVEVSEVDRVFSASSITYRKSLDMAEDSSSLEDNINPAHVNTGTGITTVTLTPATRAQEAQVQSKRERDRIYQRKKRASMRQSTISDEELPPKKRRKFVED